MGRKCSVRAILSMSALYEFLSELTHAPNVVYVVIWTIMAESSNF